MTSKAFEEGWDAFYAGKNESANPYDPQSDEHLDWNDGWLAAEETDEP